MPIKKDISFYSNAVTKIRRAPQNGGAPHKPILLISVLQAVREKQITDNKIYITPELVGLFKSNWNKYVTTNHHTKFFLPFFHLSRDKSGFWRLIPNLGYEKLIEPGAEIRSFRALKLAIKYAEIDIELFHLMLEENSNKTLHKIIVDKYFPHKKDDNDPSPTNYITQISNEILEESTVEYVKKTKQLRANLNDEEYEEERFLRSVRFKREVLRNYNDTCCISGLRIDATANISMLDACHIIPFSESYDDTISNGLALTPTLHRAFDRGLISLNGNYQVLIKSDFIESNNSPYSIKQFEGRKILLPKRHEWFPSTHKIQYHREKFGL